jgi:hypothetical protein
MLLHITDAVSKTRGTEVCEESGSIVIESRRVVPSGRIKAEDALEDFIKHFSCRSVGPTASKGNLVG